MQLFVQNLPLDYYVPHFQNTRNDSSSSRPKRYLLHPWWDVFFRVWWRYVKSLAVHVGHYYWFSDVIINQYTSLWKDEAQKCSSKSAWAHNWNHGMFWISVRFETSWVTPVSLKQYNEGKKIGKFCMSVYGQRTDAGKGRFVMEFMGVMSSMGSRAVASAIAKFIDSLCSRQFDIFAWKNLS